MSTSTSLVTPSTESHSPWIPLEVISLILAMLWEALQTRQERRAFRNFALVSRAWLPLVAFITSRDVHISSIRSASAFLRLLPEGAPAVGCETVDMFSREAHRVARQICHSLTIHAGRVTWPYDTDSTADVLGAVTQTYPGSLPNLRHVSFRYANRDYDHILVHIMQGLFPPQVTHLSLTYPFTTPVKFPPFIPLALGVFMNEVAPNVRHLALSNVVTTFVTAMLRLCPNTETLELTNRGSLLPLSASFLPPAVRTLVLRHPGVALSKKTMSAWGLPSALEARLVVRGTKLPRIIIRSGTPDPVAFMELSRCCKRFGTELVYERERDDALVPSSHSSTKGIRVRTVSYSCKIRVEIRRRIT